MGLFSLRADRGRLCDRVVDQSDHSAGLGRQRGLSHPSAFRGGPSRSVRCRRPAGRARCRVDVCGGAADVGANRSPEAYVPRFRVDPPGRPLCHPFCLCWPARRCACDLTPWARAAPHREPLASHRGGRACAGGSCGAHGCDSPFTLWIGRACTPRKLTKRFAPRHRLSHLQHFGARRPAATAVTSMSRAYAVRPVTAGIWRI